MADVAEQLTLDIDVDERLRRNIKILIAAGLTTAPALYKLLGLTRTTFSQRLTGPKPTQFSFKQVLTIAHCLGLAVEDLIQPSEQLLAQVAQIQKWKKKIPPDLRGLTGGGKAKMAGQRAMRLFTFPLPDL